MAIKKRPESRLGLRANFHKRKSVVPPEFGLQRHAKAALKIPITWNDSGGPYCKKPVQACGWWGALSAFRRRLLHQMSRSLPLGSCGRFPVNALLIRNITRAGQKVKPAAEDLSPMAKPARSIALRAGSLTR